MLALSVKSHILAVNRIGSYKPIRLLAPINKYINLLLMVSVYYRHHITMKILLLLILRVIQYLIALCFLGGRGWWFHFWLVSDWPICRGAITDKHRNLRRPFPLIESSRWWGVSSWWTLQEGLLCYIIAEVTSFHCGTSNCYHGPVFTTRG